MISTYNPPHQLTDSNVAMVNELAVTAVWTWKEYPIEIETKRMSDDQFDLVLRILHQSSVTVPVPTSNTNLCATVQEINLEYLDMRELYDEYLRAGISNDDAFITSLVGKTPNQIFALHPIPVPPSNFIVNLWEALVGFTDGRLAPEVDAFKKREGCIHRTDGLIKIATVFGERLKAWKSKLEKQAEKVAAACVTLQSDRRPQQQILIDELVDELEQLDDCYMFLFPKDIKIIMPNRANLAVKSALMVKNVTVRAFVQSL